MWLVGDELTDEEQAKAQAGVHFVPGRSAARRRFESPSPSRTSMPARHAGVSVSLLTMSFPASVAFLLGSETTLDGFPAAVAALLGSETTLDEFSCCC